MTYEDITIKQLMDVLKNRATTCEEVFEIGAEGIALYGKDEHIRVKLKGLELDELYKLVEKSQIKEDFIEAANWLKRGAPGDTIETVAALAAYLKNHDPEGFEEINKETGGVFDPLFNL